jgi:tRNA(Ile2)-agmatinylcytidine synthase
MGTNSGYRCRRAGCGFKDSEMGKVKVPVAREIGEGFYEPPPVAWRHLYKPLARGVG